MPADIAEAFRLLDEIAYAGRVKQTERVAAWRAIKTIRSSGVPEHIWAGLITGMRALRSGDQGMLLAHQLKKTRYHLTISGFTIRRAWYESK